MKLQKQIIFSACLLGAFAVVLGAFGAHFLADRLNDASLKTYETAVKYQFYHALLLIIIGFNTKYFSSRIKLTQWLIIVGVLFFSGSIYLLATRMITNIPTVILGPMTPIGGILLILAWLSIIIFFKNEAE